MSLHTRFVSRLTCVASLLVVAVIVPPATVHAAQLGVRGGVYTQAAAAFVGVEILSEVGESLYFDPNVEYVFVDHEQYGTLNFDAHYDLPTHGQPYVWVGAGLGLSYRKPDGPAPSDTGAHLNLLAGVGFHMERSVPYVQLKLVTGHPNELVAAVGLRF